MTISVVSFLIEYVGGCIYGRRSFIAGVLGYHWCHSIVIQEMDIKYSRLGLTRRGGFAQMLSSGHQRKIPSVDDGKLIAQNLTTMRDSS